MTSRALLPGVDWSDKASYRVYPAKLAEQRSDVPVFLPTCAWQAMVEIWQSEKGKGCVYLRDMRLIEHPNVEGSLFW